MQTSLPTCSVSIIMAAYNAEDFIGTAIESALTQTVSDFEIVVIDDCSTDGTAEVIKAYQARDGRVRYARMPRNAGPSAARNAGYDLARGEWVAALDADDSYAPPRLEHLLALGRGNNADMVSDNLLMLPSDNSPQWVMIPPDLVSAPRHLSRAEFVEGNVGDPKRPRFSFGFMHPMIRTDLLRRTGLRYDVRNRFGEDYMLYVSLLRAGASWWVTPEPMYHYVLRSGSLTESQSAADLLRISQFDAASIQDPLVQGDTAFRNALKRHKTKIDREYYYRAFTDAVKGRQFGKATAVLTDTRRSPLYIGQELARQTPVILKKAFRGGYASAGKSKSAA